MSEESSAPKKSINGLTLYVIIVSALAGALYGLDIGVINGALHFIKAEMHLTPFEEGLIVGAVLYGGSIAIVVTGFLSDIFGRKKMIILSAIIFIIGVFLSSKSHTFETLLAGRLVMGIGVGVSAILIPLYLSETAPAHVRGRAVACYQLFLTAGIFCAYLVGLAFSASGNWRAMFDVLAIPGAILFIGSLFIPESPTWLFMKEKMELVKSTLAKFHGHEDSEKIFSEMTTLKEEQTGEPFSAIFKKKAYVVPFIIAFLVACLNQTTGINCVLQYVSTIFTQSGVHSQTMSNLLSTGVGLANFIVTIIALSLIDKLGRKFLLTISTGGVVIFLCLMGVASLMGASTFKITLLAVGLYGFTISFAIGCGVVVWLAMSELLPSKIRSVGLALCLFCNSMISSILANVFPVLTESIGYSGIFFLLAACSVVYFIIAAFVLPETKGKTIEEIEEYFRQK